jgi:hypothetical protein
VFALEVVVDLASDGEAPFEFKAWRRGRRELFKVEQQGEEDGE